MNFLRDDFDMFYDLIKPIVFGATSRDPEMAHSLFVKGCQTLSSLNLAEKVLDCEENYMNPGFTLSNAGGFNKNAEISPQVLKFLGFDRIEIGTVTAGEHGGNKRPRIVRYSDRESMVNFMGWNSEGVDVVGKRLESYGDHEVPISINFGPTNKPEIMNPERGDSLTSRLSDCIKTIERLRDVPYVDRWVFNAGCPNTEVSVEEFHKELDSFLELTNHHKRDFQDVYVKVTPDLNLTSAKLIAKILINKDVDGVITANSTTQRQGMYLPHPYSDKGGASGKVVYEPSIKCQKMFYDLLKDSNISIVGCGGIDSFERVSDRLDYGAKEMQIFTPLIFKGPGLLRKLRSSKYNVKKL